MTKLSSLLSFSFLIICTPVWADEMNIQFTFGPPRPCTTVFPNPEIKMKSVPPGTHTIVVKFRREKNYEMGGQEIPFPSDNIVKPESLRTWGPCNSGLYTYEIIAKSSTGAALAKAEWSEPYPP